MTWDDVTVIASGWLLIFAGAYGIVRFDRWLTRQGWYQRRREW